MLLNVLVPPQHIVLPLKTPEVARQIFNYLPETSYAYRSSYSYPTKLNAPIPPEKRISELNHHMLIANSRPKRNVSARNGSMR